MNEMQIILLLLGLITATITIVFYRDEILKWLKLHKKQVAVGLTTATTIGAGMSGFFPESYRPPTETLIQTSDGDYYPGLEDYILEAYDSCSTPGWVRLPDGDFHLSFQLNITSNKHLIGNGPNATILINDKTDDARTGIIRADGQHNWSISQLTVKGNSANNPSSYNCIDIHNCVDFSISYVNVEDPSKNGIRIYGDSSNGFVDHVRAGKNITSAYHAIGIGSVGDGGCNRMDVSHCYLYNSTGSSLDISNTTFSTFSNINIENVTYGFKLVGESHHNSLENFVIDDVVDNYAFWTEDTYSNTFLNFNINNVTNSIAAKLGGNSGPVHHSTFNNIKIDNASGDGFYMYNGGVINHNNTIIGLSTKNIGGDGLEIRLSKDNEIIGFHASDCAGYGLNLNNDVENCTFTAFHITNCNYGIYILDSSFVKFIGGTASHNTVDGIRFEFSDDSNNFTIMGCFFNYNAQRGIFIRDTGGQVDDFIVIGNNCLANTGTNLDDDSTGGNKEIAHNLS